MSKWMSAVLVAMLAGCGVGALPGEEPGTEVGVPREREPLSGPGVAVAASVGRRELARPRHGFVEEQVLYENVGVNLKVSGVPGANGQKLNVIFGQAGCGFSVEGTGTATVTNGVAHVSLPTVPTDRWFDLMLTIDTDGDGKCSPSDTLWSTSLATTQSSLDLSVDLSTLQAGENWMCFATE